MTILATARLFQDLPLSSYPRVAYAAAMRAPLEDTALMLRYKDGDIMAFEELYRRHNDALYRYLLRRCRHKPTAEDLYQEVWSKIIRSKERYRPTARFTTFLYRVAHNCFIDHVRRNKRHGTVSAGDPDTTVDSAPLPDALAEKSKARENLIRALQTLPAEQRDTFLLHEEAGLNLEAIAQVTGVNRETAKSRLRYAMKKLKTAMSDPVPEKEETL